MANSLKFNSFQRLMVVLLHFEVVIREVFPVDSWLEGFFWAPRTCLWEWVGIPEEGGFTWWEATSALFWEFLGSDELLFAIELPNCWAFMESMMAPNCSISGWTETFCCWVDIPRVIGKLEALVPKYGTPRFLERDPSAGVAVGNFLYMGVGGWGCCFWGPFINEVPGAVEGKLEEFGSLLLGIDVLCGTAPIAPLLATTNPPGMLDLLIGSCCFAFAMFCLNVCRSSSLIFNLWLNSVFCFCNSWAIPANLFLSILKVSISFLISWTNGESPVAVPEPSEIRYENKHKNLYKFTCKNTGIHIKTYFCDSILVSSFEER